MSNVIGHKGHPSTALENSKESILNAINLSELDGIEIDVKITKDKKLILMHNATLNHINKKRGLITKKTYDELIGNDMIWHPDYLKQLVNKIASFSFKDGKIIRERLKKMRSFIFKIDTFEDIIDLFNNYDKKLIIDLKIKKYDKEIKDLIIKNLRKIKTPQIYLTGYNLNLLLEIKKENPTYKVGLILLNPNNKKLKLPIDFISIKYFLVTKKFLKKQIEDKKREVFVWNIDSSSQYKYLLKRSGKYIKNLFIISNYPDYINEHHKKHIAD